MGIVTNFDIYVHQRVQVSSEIRFYDAKRNLKSLQPEKIVLDKWSPWTFSWVFKTNTFVQRN